MTVVDFSHVYLSICVLKLCNKVDNNTKIDCAETLVT